MIPKQTLSLLQKEADRCVKCGLCLPECPTYRLTANEAESPRGRISLIEAIANQQLGVSLRIDEHLDTCLMCLRCEDMCPSQVKYARLMDKARELIYPQRPLWQKMLVDWLSNQGRAAVLTKLARLPFLPSAFSIPAPFPIEQMPRENQSENVGEKPQVALFTGCVSGVLQSRALNATRQLLEIAGHDVKIPDGQQCCGAMHGHMGDDEKAQRLQDQNREVFEESETLISVASGCGAYISQAGFDQHLDISTFLIRHKVLDGLSFKALQQKIAVHVPCSLMNVLGGEQDMWQVLSLIPGLELIELPDNKICCGSAGIYSLTHGTIARQLRDPKIMALKEIRPDIMVTANPGCAVHLAKGMEEEGLEIPIMHPVEILQQQLSETQR